MKNLSIRGARVEFSGRFKESIADHHLVILLNDLHASGLEALQLQDAVDVTRLLLRDGPTGLQGIRNVHRSLR